MVSGGLFGELLERVRVSTHGVYEVGPLEATRLVDELAYEEQAHLERERRVVDELEQARLLVARPSDLLDTPRLELPVRLVHVVIAIVSGRNDQRR